jgi:hypothetical protein
VQPTGGRNDDRGQGSQPPPASDPWGQNDTGDQGGAAGGYSVPSSAPASGSNFTPPVDQQNDDPPSFDPQAYEVSPISPAYGQDQPPQQHTTGYAPYGQPGPAVPQQFSGPPMQSPSTGYMPGYQPGPPPPQPPFAPGPPMPMAPVPPRKSNSGLIIGLIAGAVVVVLLVCGGAVWGLHLFGTSDDGKGANASTSRTPGAFDEDDTPAPTRTTKSPTPAATSRTLTTLDDASTDKTPFELTQFFPKATYVSGAGETYTRTAAGFYSACENAGGERMKPVLKKNTCGNMAVGVYLNQAQTIMTGVMVMPFPNATAATNVFNSVKADTKMQQEFWIWCPPAGQPGANICTSNTRNQAYRQWVYEAFHRYFIVSISLHVDGRSKGDVAALTKADNDCMSHVDDALPTIWSS